jgi:hypothetical protein
METIGQRVSQLMTVLGNMVFTDDNKISPQMLEANFPKWKQDALLIIYNGSGGIKGVLPPIKANRFINSANYVKTRLLYDANIQDEGAEYVIFEVKDAVQIERQMNGFVFVGDKLTGKSFSQLLNPNSYSINKQAGLIDVNTVCFNVTGSQLKVFGNTQVREVFLDYIPTDVTEVTVYDTTTKTWRLFDPEFDPYPISEDVWGIMKSLAISEFTPANYRPADYLNDSIPLLEKQANA